MPGTFQGDGYSHPANRCPLYAHQGFKPLTKAEQVKDVQGNGCSFCGSGKHTRFFCFDFNTLRTKAGLPFMIVRSGEGEWVAAPDYENETIRARAGTAPSPRSPLRFHLRFREEEGPLHPRGIRHL